MNKKELEIVNEHLDIALNRYLDETNEDTVKSAENLAALKAIQDLRNNLLNPGVY